MVSASDRRLDAIVMRVMDGIMSIPAILLAIALMAVTGGSVLNVIVAVTIVEIPRVARLIRGIVLSLREQPYVEAAIAAGTSRPSWSVPNQWRADGASRRLPGDSARGSPFSR